MFNKFFGLGAYAPELLHKRARRELCGLSPQELAGAFLDIELVKYGVPVVEALSRAAEILYPSFLEHFKGCRWKDCGGVAVSGLIRLPGEEGVVLFSLGDCIAAAASRGKVSYASKPIHPFKCYIDGFVGASGNGQAERFSEPSSVNVKHFTPEEARRTVFFLLSDGLTIADGGFEALSAALGPALGQASDLVENAKRYADSAARSLERSLGSRFKRDDESVAALEGALLY